MKIAGNSMILNGDTYVFNKNKAITVGFTCKYVMVPVMLCKDKDGRDDVYIKSGNIRIKLYEDDLKDTWLDTPANRKIAKKHIDQLNIDKSYKNK